MKSRLKEMTELAHKCSDERKIEPRFEFYPFDRTSVDIGRGFGIHIIWNGIGNGRIPPRAYGIKLFLSQIEKNEWGKAIAQAANVLEEIARLVLSIGEFNYFDCVEFGPSLLPLKMAGKKELGCKK